MQHNRLNDLVTQAQAGHLEAFEELYEMTAPAVMRVAYRMLHSKEDAEDAVQAVYIKLHRGIKSFRFQSSLTTYLYRMTVNQCLDLMEKNKRTRELSEQSVRDEPASSPRALLRLKLQQAVDRLPERMRTAFILHVVEGLSHQETAQIMGNSLGTVKAHIHQAKLKLRTLLRTNPEEAAS